MLEYKTKVNESVFIRWQGQADATAVYPQAKIYNVLAPAVVV